MSGIETPVCDRRSVGLVVECEGRVLLGAAPASQAGYAPVGGHCDGLDMRAAARALCERIGLSAPVLLSAAEGWRPGMRERPLEEAGEPGHQWTVCLASGRGTPCDQRGQLQLHWWTREQLQNLTDRTVAYARGALGGGAWRVSPGLAPVWVGWLAKLRLVSATLRDQHAVARLAAPRDGGAR